MNNNLRMLVQDESLGGGWHFAEATENYQDVYLVKSRENHWLNELIISETANKNQFVNEKLEG